MAKQLKPLVNKKQLGEAIEKDKAGMRSGKYQRIECAFNLGEHIIQAKGLFDDYADWLEEQHSIKRGQASKYIRIAIHKDQVRQLLLDNENISIEELQKLIPKASESPVEIAADVKKLGYVGTKPGTTQSSDDWHTPEQYTDAALEVMGSIDLDPFSSVQANMTINAPRIFTVADNAFEISWASPETRTVWMNPPYSRGASSKSVEKFLEEYDIGSFDQAVVLMNSSTDTSWFHRMANAASSVCFTAGRISFEDAGGKRSSGNTKGQVFFYFGKRNKTFDKVFSEFGLVLNTRTVR